ncbi:MAG: formylglycine-generating enzyme family protein [Hyphomicrobiaceae bacterium]
MAGRKAGCGCAPERDDTKARATSKDTAGVFEAIPTSAPRLRYGEERQEMALIPAGTFLMGCQRREGHRADGEWPVRNVYLDAFLIDRCAVTNERFARFVSETGYVTEAEQIGWSFVFAGLLPDDFEETRGIAAAPWWRQVMAADWQHPEGPHSDISERSAHPVVHVSHSDALAFCAWAGKRLPTEAEWEKAARGGLAGARFPWGDEETPGDQHRCNVWQGRFPDLNTQADGFYGTAPADAFAPNGFGLHNMAGNAWEWCADWFTRDRGLRLGGEEGVVHNPSGPATGELRAMRGGSYLCHPSYCWRYRCAARSAASPDSASGHMGFRCVSDLASH